MDRLVDWLEDHRDVPSFVYLHLFDPHSPYEPNRPYDTMWADPAAREEYNRHLEVLRKHIKNAFNAQRGMATPDELKSAGIDAAGYLRFPSFRAGPGSLSDPAGIARPGRCPPRRTAT